MGLCGEVSNIDEKKIYGVMPFVAPEVLKGNPYTQAADIYSFGMIMWELTTGCKPFANVEHDINLIFEILDGERPEITEDTPECYANLMKNCWDSNPNNRPNALDLVKSFNSFRYIKNE